MRIPSEALLNHPRTEKKSHFLANIRKNNTSGKNAVCMARKRLVTVEEAILMHLLDYARYSSEDTVPMELAQAGISQALGVRRSHVSMSLDSAKSKGMVEEHIARVKGESRRRKA